MSVTRRTFIKVAGVTGAGLTLGIGYKVATGGPPDLVTDAAFAPNAFLRIDTDGSITIMVGRSEMGQGVATALPQLLAEELDVGMDRVTFEFAPAHPAYAGAQMGMQVTGGSTSVMESWTPLREAGATARLMLRQAAANEWGADLSTTSTGDAAVWHPDGRTLGYGELATAAAALPVPETPPLKNPADFSLIGSSVPRLDVPAKTDGTAVFGVDAGPPDARIAMVARPAVFGGKVRSFDPAPALAVEGVTQVMEIEDGVAVLADGYWPAKKGRDALVVEWDDGDGALLNDAGITDVLQAAIQDGGAVARDDGDVATVLAAAGEPMEATYTLPYLAHATMEPMNCTALVENGRCTVWAPTQFQDGPSIAGGARQTAAKAAGVDANDTEVITTYLGGGFGRRAEMDFVREAAELAGKVDGAVKVMWSREDDTQRDFYRPASRHELTAVLGDDGRPAVWTHDMAMQSIFDRLLPSWMPGFLRNMTMTPGGIDPTSIEGAANHPYHVPNTRVTCAKVELPIPVGFWRSVGHSHTGFVVESFVDELAHAAGQDPVAYRRALLSEHPRHAGVLDAVAAAADWGSPVPEGRARGVAVVESFGSYVAQVAEVSMESGRPRVHKVWCSVDCGVVVNPAIVRAQMESGILYGLTAALYGRISIQEGRVVQGNFGDYRIVRMAEAPEIEVVLAPSGDAPGGVGEVGTPPIAPAVTNAIFALTGERIRDLPIVST